MKLAIVAFGPKTRQFVLECGADLVWSMSDAYLFDWMPKLDLLFELHQIWSYRSSIQERYKRKRDQDRWLRDNRAIPVMMLEDRPDYPMSRAYPLGAIKKRFNPRFLTSTIDLMLAYAIHDGHKEIYLYGAEMGHDTEYRYQRPGLAYWLGMADGLGIDINLANKGSGLLPGRVYGFEAAQMIFRHDLEILLEQQRARLAQLDAKINHVKGQLQALYDAGVSGDRVTKLKQESDSLYDRILLMSGSIQTLEQLIKNVDVEMYGESKKNENNSNN